eukprot:2248968-Pyramimonas_sp.AAC.1
MFEECHTWPWQLMGVLGRLLPKKAEGHFRVIGLICALCRVWSLAREPVVQARAQAEQPSWGAAVRGNSSLEEAFMRALDDELFTRLKLAKGYALADIQSFYDMMEWSTLVKGAFRYGFPAVMLGLELQICAAPRMLDQ